MCVRGCMCVHVCACVCVGACVCMCVRVCAGVRVNVHYNNTRTPATLIATAYAGKFAEVAQAPQNNFLVTALADRVEKPAEKINTVVR